MRPFRRCHMMYEPTAVIWRIDTVTAQPSSDLWIFAWSWSAWLQLNFRCRPAADIAAVGQFRRQTELNCFLAAGQFADIHRAEPAQCIDDVLHQHFGCRS